VIFYTIDIDAAVSGAKISTLNNKTPDKIGSAANRQAWLSTDRIQLVCGQWCIGDASLAKDGIVYG
jgi:hypothetical protein